MPLLVTSTQGDLVAAAITKIVLFFTLKIHRVRRERKNSFRIVGGGQQQQLQQQQRQQQQQQQQWKLQFPPTLSIQPKGSSRFP